MMAENKDRKAHCQWQGIDQASYHYIIAYQIADGFQYYMGKYIVDFEAVPRKLGAAVQ
jgi:hypothetical protein